MEGRGSQTVSRIRCGVIPPLAHGFYARPETAAEISFAMESGDAVVLTSADAPGSWQRPAGTTQLAVSVADSLWRSFSADLIAWIDGRTRASMISGYARAAAAIGLAPTRNSEAAASHFLAELAGTSLSWLVVLDGVPDAADLGGAVPRGPAGRLLITARTSSDRPSLPVGVFSPREAVSYLTGRLSEDTDLRQGVIDLADDLRGEPLALAQAGAVMVSTGMTCRDYRAMFASRRTRLAEAGSAPVTAAAVTWTLSYDEAIRISAGGLRLPPILVFSALLDGHGIPAPVYTAPAACALFGMDDPARIGQALGCLERTGLLSIGRTDQPQTVWISAAVQDAVRAAASAEMIEQAARAVADALVQVWPPSEPSAWLAEPLRSSAASISAIAGDTLWDTYGWHPLVPLVGRSLESSGLAGPAVAYWGGVSATAERMLPPDHPETRAATERTAAACLAAGRGAEAVAWYQRVVADQLRAVGPDHPLTFEARTNMGRALLVAGQHTDGIAVLAGVARECERTLGPADARTLDARDVLAAAFHAAGRLAEAARHYRDSLADRERIQGRHHPSTMSARAELAAVCMADGNVRDAISLYKRVLGDRERVLGKDHPETVSVRASLATAYQSAGRIRRIRELPRAAIRP